MAYSNGYSFRKLYSQNHSLVSGGSNLTDFPLLISVTDAALKTVANGGKVQSASGFDIRFESTGGTKLDHELDTGGWSASSGLLRAWVRVPTLLSGSDTTFYLYYGNAAVVATEENPSGVWSGAGFVGHMGDAATASGTDSSGNGNTLTAFGSPGGAAGLVGGATTFAGGTDRYQRADAATLDATTALTVEATVNLTTTGGAQTYVRKNGNYILRQDAVVVGNGTAFFWWDNTNLRYLAINSPLSTGTPHRIVGTAAANDVVGLYIDGVLVDGTPKTFFAVGRDLTMPLALAQVEGGGSEVFVGSLDEVRVWPAVTRSAGWVATDYAAQSSPGTFGSFGTEQTSGTAALPGVGALTLAGLAPSVLTPRVARPGVGSVTLAGLSPTIRANVAARPGVGALTLTGFVPTIVATPPVYVEESSTRQIDAPQALRSLLQAVPLRALGTAPSIRVLTPAMPLTTKQSVPAVRTIQPAALLITD